MYFRFSSVLLLVCYFRIFTTVESEVYHLLPSQSDSCSVDYHDCLTLSQFINKSSIYLADNTTLIFTPGRHTMESELMVANFHTFSMFAETSPFVETEIVCCDQANFIFSNVTAVIIDGFKVSECRNNKVNSVHQFHLNGEAHGISCGTVLTMIETVSYLDEVNFTFHHIYYTEQQMQRHRNHTMPTELDVCPGTTLFTDESVVTITQSSFIDLEKHWRVLHSKHSSEIFILSTIFKSNDFYYQSDILYVTSNSKVNLYGCRFEQYKGAVDAKTPSVLNVTDSVLSIINSIFINNTRVLLARNTSLRISQTVLKDNQGHLLLIIGGIASIDSCNFIN